MAKQKYYVVWKGVSPGVFDNWAECLQQVTNYTGAIYKSFNTKLEAIEAFRSDAGKYFGKPAKPQLTCLDAIWVGKPIIPSLSVDAACAGNPGVMEYRGVDTQTGKELFRQGPFKEGTVNIGEFLAIVHGLAYLKQINSNIPVYSDSKTAIKWIYNKKNNSKLIESSLNFEIFDLMGRAEKWLRENFYNNRLLKWETSIWGEIPADFGRK
ncbi:MAG: ribonuclease H family protein [Lentimicrobiaceae bacterium]|nr:ribonuclease H family protein [Lentimicrobiaceae bacterium]